MNEPVPAGKLRITWIDNVKVLATVAVVALHVSAYGVGLEAVGSGYWWAANFYESLCRCCVPLFVMVTGLLLLLQEITLTDFICKRFNRILLPFLFWIVIYLAYHFAQQLNGATFTSPAKTFDWIFTQLFVGPEYHLWYVYMLIGLYLFIPIIQPWIRSADDKNIIYFLAIWLVVLLLKQFQLPPGTSLDLRYFSGYLGYLVLGYYLGNRATAGGKAITIALPLALFGFLVTFIGTWWLSKYKAVFTDQLYDFLTFNVFMLTAGVFLLIKNWSGSRKANLISRSRNIISRYGFSIYLAHPLLLNIMNHFKLGYKVLHPAIGIPVTTLICLLLSFVLVYLLSKLPGGKYISG